MINGYLVFGTPFHPHAVGFNAPTLEEAVAVDSLQSKSPYGQPDFISPQGELIFTRIPRKVKTATRTTFRKE